MKKNEYNTLSCKLLTNMISTLRDQVTSHLGSDGEMYTNIQTFFVIDDVKIVCCCLKF